MTHLVSSDLWQFLRLFSLFVALTDLRNTAGQAFCRMFLNWGFTDAVLMMRLGDGLLERRPQTCEHHCSPALTGGGDLDHVVKVMSAGFFTVKLAFSSFPHALICGGWGDEGKGLSPASWTGRRLLITLWFLL